MEWFASQEPHSYSLYFDLNIWFRAWKVTTTFKKRAPGLWLFGEAVVEQKLECSLEFHNTDAIFGISYNLRKQPTRRC